MTSNKHALQYFICSLNFKSHNFQTESHFKLVALTYWGSTTLSFLVLQLCLRLRTGTGAIVVTHHATHMARVWCKAGIKCLSCTEKQVGPNQVVQKFRHKFHMGVRNQVGRHGLYSGHYSGVFVTPKCAWNAETMHQSGAVPILLLAILALMASAYSSLGVLQGLNPQRWLLKASAYHPATVKRL